MPLEDLWGLLAETLKTQRLRTFLTMLGIVIGMAAVILVSSIGEGTREGIAAEFTQFGTTIIGVRPGRAGQFGVGPGMAGGTTHPMTLEDALALRHVAGIRYLAPHMMGMGEIDAAGRTRQTYVYGTTWEDQHCMSWYPRIGSFLPEGDPEQMPPVCVLGATVAREVFPDANPLGARVRIGQARFTVIGVMAPKGQMLGFDLDDMTYIPVRRALRLFNRQDVQEIHILAASSAMVDPVTEDVRRILRERHDGDEDFTITTQRDGLKLVDEVMQVLTAGVMVIAAISVFVGAMGILTIMWVSVHERTQEIGLIKALGASDRQVLVVFLAEAVALSLIGGAAGVATGAATGWIVTGLVPGFWFQIPPWAVPMALAVSMVVGAAAGALPAARAARLDPVEALRAE